MSDNAIVQYSFADNINKARQKITERLKEVTDARKGKSGMKTRNRTDGAKLYSDREAVSAITESIDDQFKRLTDDQLSLKDKQVTEQTINVLVGTGVLRILCHISDLLSMEIENHACKDVDGEVIEACFERVGIGNMIGDITIGTRDIIPDSADDLASENFPGLPVVGNQILLGNRLFLEMASKLGVEQDKLELFNALMVDPISSEEQESDQDPSVNSLLPDRLDRLNKKK